MYVVSQSSLHLPTFTCVKNHTPQVILGEPVTALFSHSQMSLERLNLRRQFLRSFSICERKMGFLMLFLCLCEITG